MTFKLKAVQVIASAVGLLALAGTADAKWISGTFNVTTGTTDLFLHVPCTATNPVAVSGGFLPNSQAKAGLQFLGNGPRVDISPPSFNEWSWIFDWPSGAAAGSQIRWAVYCKKN